MACSGFKKFICDNFGQSWDWCHECYDWVWEITCLDSMRIANPWCSNVQNIEYRKGEEPKKVCRMHEKPEPEYTECKFPVHKIDKIVWWDGHAYEGLSMKWRKPNFTYKLWDELSEYMAQCVNGERFFAYCSENDWYLKHCVMPPEKKPNGKFNWEKLSPEYLDLILPKIESNAKRRMNSAICLFSSLKTLGGRWDHCPWNGNRNINKTTTNVKDFCTDRRSIDIQKIHIELLWDELKQFYPYVDLELANEYTPGQGKLYRWSKELYTFMRSIGIPYNRIHVGYSGLGSCSYHVLDTGVWMPAHGVNSVKDMWKRRQSSDRWQKYLHGRSVTSGDGKSEHKKARGLIRHEQRKKKQWEKRKASGLQMRRMADYDFHISNVSRKHTEPPKDGIYGNGHEFMTSAPFAWEWFEHYVDLTQSIKIGVEGLTTAEAIELNVDPDEYKVGELIYIKRGHAGNFPEGKYNPPPPHPKAIYGSCKK